MKKIYRFEPRVYPNTVTGVTRISYFNVALAAFITQKSLELKEVIQKLPPQLQCEFLRSFFNDEGCVDFRVQKKIRRIRGYQKDVNILVLVRSLLHQQGIASHIEKPNEVVVSGKKNLILFQKKIGFSEGVRVNGSRSNSRWKQDLEKRLILRQAIDSFIT
ncbi:hypothetical protein EBR66_02040 [bacterium]|nr:hypothetical protein [bacterium]